jgi:hypothetical protein
MTRSEQAAVPRSHRAGLLGILAASYGLRLWLAAGGGQGFWPDESRYDSARRAAADLLKRDWRAALSELFGHADHVLFRLASLPAALPEALAGGFHPVIVSCYFSLFSVGVIYLVWAIARRAGAPEREALWGAFLAAASNSLFFYARHFLPYDMALLGMLAALWLALGNYSAANSLRIGCMVGLGFLTYNGYWLLGAGILTLNAALGAGGPDRLWKRAVFSVGGLALTVAVVVGIGVTVSPGLLAEYVGFSGSVKQGDFHIGYRVIAEYLWHAEHGLALLWVAALAYAVAAALRAGNLGRLWWWLGGIVIVFGGLVFFSDVVPRFMVYGRLTRAAVPFACLGAGLGIAQFLEARGRWRNALSCSLAALVFCLAASNFAVPLRQVFPDRFQALAARLIASQRDKGDGFYRVLFAEPLWGRPLEIGLPPHVELLRSPNPMQFRPYQYEGYPAALRDQLNRFDVAMQVVKIPFQASRSRINWEGYPGPVRIKLRFAPDYWGESEPILASGTPGLGDLIVAKFMDPDHIVLGLDHWSYSEIDSDPIAIDYSATHELAISEGPLVPPAGSALYERHPELEGLRGQIVIILDGRVVLSKHSEFHPSSPGTLYWGSNAIGASTAVPDLRGSVYEIASAPLALVAQAVPSMAALELARGRAPEWRGALGPIRLRFTMAQPTPEVSAEPLLSINGPGNKDVLFVSWDGPDRIRIGLDRKGAGAVMSAPLSLSPSELAEVDVCLGSLLPDATAPIFGRFPGFERMRSLANIRFNSQPALEAGMPFSPAQAYSVTVGANTIGSSTYCENFRGNILAFEAIGPENIPGFGTRLSDLLDNLDPDWGGFPGPFGLRAVFPRGRAGHREPLLSSGSGAAADTLFVQYDSDSQVRFGFERSGGAPILSMPVAIEPGKAQELLVSAGFLMPEERSPLYLKVPEVDPLRSFVHVGINRRPVLHEYAERYPSLPDGAALGVNLRGPADIDPRFQGTIESVTSARTLDVFEDGSIGAGLARPGWGGYPGPLRITMVFPAGATGEGQPIVTTGSRGIGDVIYLRYEAGGMARIGQDHWGSKLLLSEPFELKAGSQHTLAVSLGSLYPPAVQNAAGDGKAVDELRGMTVVVVDGRTVLSESEPSHPSTPERITVGANLIGGTTSRSLFSGRILSVEPAEIGSVRP